MFKVHGKSIFWIGLLFIIKDNLKEQVNDKKKPKFEPHLDVSLFVFVVVDDDVGRCDFDSSGDTSFELYFKSELRIENLECFKIQHI